MSNITETSDVMNMVMLPWLAHGHISPFLELAKKLNKRNFTTYLCSTPINLLSISTNKNLRKRSPSSSSSSSSSIQLVEIHLPSLPDLPPHYHTTNGLPPHLMPTLKLAFQMAKPELSNILMKLNPDFFVYDTIIPWAGDVAFSLGIPAFDFLTAGASMGSFFIHALYKPGIKFPLPAIYLHDYELRKIRSEVEHAQKFDLDKVWPDSLCNIRLIKSFRELEGKYIDYFSELTKKKVFPVGPLFDADDDDNSRDDSEHLIRWLDKKHKRSCVFVSFGSECFLTKEETREIAHGLEQSGVNFIWVLRFPKIEGTKKMGVGEVLPNGFLERVGEKGKVVEGWAPQARILRHEGIGGFVSHCGWGSLLESLRYGVGIIGIPMQLDQPMNARLAVEVGVAVEVMRVEDGRITGSEVAKAIRKVVMEEGGEGIRMKTKEFSDILKSKGEEEEEIDELVKELLQIRQSLDK